MQQEAFLACISGLFPSHKMMHCSLFGVLFKTLCPIRGFPKLRPNKICQISQKYLTLTKTLVGIEPRS